MTRFVNDLIGLLHQLPGIGKKGAGRIAYHLLQTDPGFNTTLASHISALRDRVHRCSSCQNYAEEKLCAICSSSTRNRAQLCVVERPQDIPMIEVTGEYNGLFYVLHGVLSPLEGVGVNELRLDSLKERASHPEVEEVIIATPPTTAGDTTALYISDLLEGKNLLLSRIASGLPVGGDFEYADPLSIGRALKARRSLEE